MHDRPLFDAKLHWDLKVPLHSGKLNPFSKVMEMNTVVHAGFMIHRIIAKGGIFHNLEDAEIPPTCFFSLMARG